MLIQLSKLVWCARSKEAACLNIYFQGLNRTINILNIKYDSITIGISTQKGAYCTLMDYLVEILREVNNVDLESMSDVIE